MINASFLLGYPVTFDDGICMVYPPKIKDILGNKNYPVYRKLFLSSQEDIEDEWTEAKLQFDQVPTPLEYLFIMAADEKIKQIILDGFEFFIKEPVTMLNDQKMIIVGDLASTLKKIKSVDQLRIIREENYFDFQQLLRSSIGEKQIEPYNPNEHPKVRYFKAKQRLRDRVKAKSKDALTLGSTLAAICCMGLGLNPLNVGELSQAAVSVLIRYYQEKDKYEIDIQSLLAGADSKKVKPKSWIRNIEDM